MKKLIVLLCCIVAAIGISCKKTCSCKLIYVDNLTGNIISSSFDGTYQIDRKETCEMLAIDKNGKMAGENFLAWLIISGMRGEPVSTFQNHSFLLRMQGTASISCFVYEVCGFA